MENHPSNKQQSFRHGQRCQRHGCVRQGGKENGLPLHSAFFAYFLPMVEYFHFPFHFLFFSVSLLLHEIPNQPKRQSHWDQRAVAGEQNASHQARRADPQRAGGWLAEAPSLGVRRWEPSRAVDQLIRYERIEAPAIRSGDLQKHTANKVQQKRNDEIRCIHEKNIDVSASAAKPFLLWQETLDVLNQYGPSLMKNPAQLLTFSNRCAITNNHRPSSNLHA